MRKEYILRACEASLRRLQVDCIDLYQTHFDDEVTPVEETLDAYAQLIKSGKVRAIGASNVSPRAAAGVARRQQEARHAALRSACSRSITSTTAPASRRDYAPICRRERLGVITYYSLAAGFLTGKYRSAADTAKSAARGGKMKEYLNERG